MADNEYLKKTLEHYRQQRQVKANELHALDLFIAQLERDSGQPHSTPATPSMIPLMGAKPDSTSQQKGRVEIRPDEFVGMTQSEAAKAYLTKVGHGIPLDDLVTALRNGGAVLGGADPKRTLYVSLARNPQKWFVFVNDVIGLRSFYPNLGKGGTPRVGNANKAARKKAKRAPRKTEKQAKAKTPEPDNSKLREAVLSTMSSGDFMDPKDVVKKVKEHLGEDVTPISVYGMLRTKGKFEKSEDGKYRVATVH